jgi:hypothetical protein
MGAVTRGMIGLFLEHYSALFNFIPSSQARNIRWLKQGGFEFFEHDDIDSDLLFFGQGHGVTMLAADAHLWTTCLGAALEKNKHEISTNSLVG